MKLSIDADGVWYHGSPLQFTTLKTGSTITQWRALAEAFSHKPSMLSYGDDGSIQHNGTAHGYLYVVDEPIVVDKDISQHPHTTMDANAEFLTKRPIKVRLIADLSV